MAASKTDAPHKTDFDGIYDQPDPRRYYATLGTYDYAIPEHGAQLFGELLQARGRTNGRARPRVLDLCCSYGVVGTLMTTDLNMKQLCAHYNDAAELTTDELVARDGRLLAAHRRNGAPKIVGLDVAENAVNYALSTGALDAAGVENLERDEPSSELVAALSDIDLVTTTGGIGYIAEETFARVLECTPPSVWVASFCLRTYDYTPIAETLTAHGLQTEHLDQTFPQRRAVSDDERRWAVEQVRANGHDPNGKEDIGVLHAGFYLSRPAAEVAACPLSQLLPSRF